MKSRKKVARRSNGGRKGHAERAAQLRKAIAISADVIRNSKSFGSTQKETMLSGLESIRQLSSAAPSTKTGKSLAYIEQAVVQPWNEVANEDAEKFWQAATAAGLEYERRDVLRDVLSRKRIKDQPEFEVIVDTVDASEDSGKITGEEAAALRKMIVAFERSH